MRPPGDGDREPRSEGDLDPRSEGDLGPRSEGDLDDLARTAQDAAHRLTGGIAGTTLVVLHAVVGWIVLSLGLVAPWWAVAALFTVWAVAGVVAWRGRAQRPIVTMLTPIGMALLTLAVVTLGAELLGWSA